MQILNRIKYVSNSRVIDTVARVADREKAIDSNNLGVLKEAIESRGKYFTKAERMYVLASLDNQYQKLSAKAGSVPEAAMIAQELRGLKNQVSSYAKPHNDSVVKRFKDGVVSVVDNVGNGFRGISLKPAYVVAGLATAVGLAVIGGGAGCKDGTPELIDSLRKQNAALTQQVIGYSNQVAQVSAESGALVEKVRKLEANYGSAKTLIDKANTEIKETKEQRSLMNVNLIMAQDRAKIARDDASRLASENSTLVSKIKNQNQQIAGMVSRKVYDEMQKSYDDKLIKVVAEARSGMVSRAEYNQIKKDNEYSTARLTAVLAEVKGLESKNKSLENRIRNMEKPAAPKTTVTQSARNAPKVAAKPVQKVPSIDYERLNKEGEIAAIAREKNYNAEMQRFAKEEALVRSRIELDKERQTAKPKKIPGMEYPEVVPGRLQARITDGGVNYNNFNRSTRAGIIDLNKPRQAQVIYNEPMAATNVVRAVPVSVEASTLPILDKNGKPYRIDVQAPSYSARGKSIKERPATRWERKAESKKFSKMPENDGIHGTGSFKGDYNYFVRNYSTSPEMGGINPKGNIKKSGEHLRGAVNNLAEIVTLQTFSPVDTKAKLGYPAAVDDFVDAGEKFVSGFNIHKEWNKVYKGTNPVTGTGRFLGRLVGNTFNLFGRGLARLVTANASERAIGPAISAGRNIVDGVVRQPLKAGANSVRGIDSEEADDAADAMNAMIDFGLDSLTMVGIDDALNPEKGMKAGEFSKYRTVSSLLAIGAEIGTGVAGKGNNSEDGGVINTLSGGRVAGPGVSRGFRVGGGGVR